MMPGLSRAVLVLLAALFAAAAPRAQEDGDEPKRIPDVSGPVLREVKSIPYPNGALYVKRGLSGAFMGGKHTLGKDQSLFQWQGELGYFYTPHVSGGVGFRITAGEPSATAQKIFNRYFLNIRLHRAWGNFGFYAGPQLGLGNLNILTDSSADTSIHTPIKNPGLSEPIKRTKPTLSLDAGGGWKFSRYLGATLGANMEYSLVTEEGVGNSNALNFHFNPGLSLDILAFTEALRELVPAFYVNVEFQAGLLVFEKSGHRQDHAEVLGISLAF